MLTIIQSFRFYFPEEVLGIVKSKLEEYDISISNLSAFDTRNYLPDEYKKRNASPKIRCCMDCQSDPKNLEKLQDYLRNDVTWHGTIIF